MTKAHERMSCSSLAILVPTALNNSSLLALYKLNHPLLSLTISSLFHEMVDGTGTKYTSLSFHRHT